MNCFGSKFIVSIFGESHSELIGMTIGGVPPGIALNIEDFQEDMNRRKSGKTGTTPRIEDDIVNVVTGYFNGYTTGSPLTLFIKNTNLKSSDYDTFITTPRPGHADFVSSIKYRGFQDYRGGGHFSGRLTAAIVAAGVIAKKILEDVRIDAYIVELGGEKDLKKALDSAILNNDSIGGIVECKIQNLKIGIGSPFFNSIESLISHIVFSIPAIKGIEFGAGFESSRLTGSENNDEIISIHGETRTNNSGGINGGISNGNEIVFRVAVKPTSSTPKTQQTINLKTQQIDAFKIEGRHDLCIALRVPVVIEAAVAIALADLMLYDNLL